MAILELTVDTQNNQILFKLESLDRIRARFKKETMLECNPFKKRRHFPEVEQIGTSRDGILTTTYMIESRDSMPITATQPYGIGMTHETGFEFVYDGNNRLRYYEVKHMGTIIRHKLLCHEK